MKFNGNTPSIVVMKKIFGPTVGSHLIAMSRKNEIHYVPKSQLEAN